MYKRALAAGKVYTSQYMLDGKYSLFLFSEPVRAFKCGHELFKQQEIEGMQTQNRANIGFPVQKQLCWLVDGKVSVSYLLPGSEQP